jgi:signal transduction histidine kinase
MNGLKRTYSSYIISNRWMAVALVFIVAVFLALNWYYYNRTRKSLDNEFGIRLKSLASLTAASVDPDDIEYLMPELIESESTGPLLEKLKMISEEYALSSVQIVREDGIVLVSTRPGLFRPGELYPMWNMDYSSIISALEGKPGATDLYRSPGGDYIKAGYAPIESHDGGVTAVAAVEANVDFLQGLVDLRTILIVATLVSSAGLALFILFVSKATGSLIKARESLHRAETLSSMGRMAAGIAHEIRNPLFIIRSSAEKLRKNEPLKSAEIEEYIIDEVDRLNGILTDYLLFARDEPTRRQNVDLVKILERNIRLVNESEEGGRAVMTTEFGISAAPVTGEEKKLQQAFLNILLNAIEASEDGGDIRIVLERAGGDFVIRFADSGCGIPERELDNVFEPFYTTKPAGSGLGLAITRKVIEDHDGTISITSREGMGCEVLVTVPIGDISPGEENE